MTPIILVGKDLGAYTFDKVAKTVTITGLDALILEQVIIIHNATVGVDIYNPADPNKTGSIAANVVTLDFDTNIASMNNTDDLIIKIWYSTVDNVVWGDKLIKILDNKIRTVASPYYAEIAFGNVANHDPRHILGHDPVTAITIQDISELGVAMIPVPASAILMEVVSTSASDAAAGVGVRTVEVVGLDASFAEISEVIILNGVTPVPTTKSYLRINSFHTETNGSFGASAVGDITLQSVGGATIYRKISVGTNKDLTAHFTVPAAKKGLILNWKGSSTGKETEIFLRATTDEEGTLLFGVYQFLDNITSKDGGMPADIKLPFFLPAQCDIKASARDVAGVGGGTADISIELFFEPV